MEIEYVAQDCAILFVRTEDKLHAANEIIKRIDNLVFEDGTPLKNKDKKYFIQLIGEFLANKRIFKYKYGGYIVAPSAYDNEMYLKLVDHILAQIKK